MDSLLQVGGSRGKGEDLFSLYFGNDISPFLTYFRAGLGYRGDHSAGHKGLCIVVVLDGVLMEVMGIVLSGAGDEARC